MQSLTGVIEHFPYAGLFLLLVLGAIGLPFPEDTTLILCGILISHEVVHPVPAVLTIYGGVLITDYSLYFLGKKYGYHVVTHRRFRKIISRQRIIALRKQFRRRGVLLIFIGRHIPLLRSQILIVSGVVRMPSGKFLMADAFSALITMALMIGAGYLGGNSLKALEYGIVGLKHVGGIAVVTALVVYIIVRYMKDRPRQERE